MRTTSTKELIALTNCEVWTQRGVLSRQTITVRNGLIESIQGDQTAITAQHEVLNAQSLTLLPAGVDAQVHLRVPGQPHKETPETGLNAAISGGVGALLTMPNTKPVIDSAESLAFAVRELGPYLKKTGVTVKISAAITMGQQSGQCVNFKELAESGICAFTDDGVGVARDLLMEKAFEASQQTGLPILQHAEVAGHGGVLAPGPIQAELGIKEYSESAEVDMVARDLKVLENFPLARYHVLHVSSAKTIDLVKRAKDKGLRVTCEVSPHHLFFSCDDIRRDNSSFKMNPPLRSKRDQAVLREALRSGDIDFVATDHAPHEPEAKTENFKTSAYGTIGLETFLPTLLTLVYRGELSEGRLVEVFSTAPAKFLGIHGQFGTLEVGKPFNACLVDVAADHVWSEKDFHSLSHNSCFVGSALRGRVKHLFVNQLHHQI